MTAILRAIFGACLGAVISRLFRREDYFYAVLAVVAFAAVCILIVIQGGR